MIEAKHSDADDDKPTTLDLFASVHEKRARGKKMSKPQPTRRLYAQLVIPARVLATRKLTIDPPFSRLAIDETYQRRELKAWVNELAHVLRSGGETPAIDVVKRSWEGGERLWIVDGQQRYWAHWDCDKPIDCLVHEVQTYQEEKDLFAVFNLRRHVSPNIQIHNHPGPTAKILRDAEASPGHPLYGRIHFKSGGPGQKVSASSLVTACARYTGGSSSTGGALGDLAASDRGCANPAGRLSVASFVTLIGRLFAPPSARPTYEMMYAIGRGLNRAGIRAESLTAPTITRLRKLHLDRVKAARAKDRMALMSAKVEKALTGKSALDDE